MARGGWRYVKAPGKNSVAETGQWSQKKKDEVFAVYLATRSISLSAAQCNVPIKTVETWRRSTWWKEKLVEYQNIDYEKLDNKLTKVIDKALDEVMDRLNSGEYQYDLITKKIIRIPAKLRDVNSALNQIIDKRQLIRKLPTKIVEQQSTAAQLANLAKQFTEFVSGKVATEKFDDLLDVVIEEETVTKNDDGTYTVKE